MKILHFVLDEKFIDGVIDVIELVDSDNVDHTFVMVNQTPQSSFSFIKKHSDIITQLRHNEILSFINNYSFDVIFLHSLYACPLEIIPQISSNLKICWVAWGYDIYADDGSKLIRLKLFHHKTKQFIIKEKKIRKKEQEKHLSFITKCKNKTKIFIKKILFYPTKEDKIRHVYEKAVERIDFFSGILGVEYSMAIQNPHFHAKQIQFIYSSTRNSVASDFTISGRNILIGNSNAYTNNHLDILKFLTSIDLKERNVYLPLSYGGGSPNYVQAIKASYQKELGDSCRFLDNFMEYEDYKKILESCGIAIFYIERQQAMGNIGMLLRSGCKVFLSETSIIYHHFKRIGAHVFSIQHDLNDTEIAKPLSSQEMEENKRLLSLTLESKLDIYRELYKTLNNN